MDLNEGLGGTWANGLGLDVTNVYKISSLFLFFFFFVFCFLNWLSDIFNFFYLAKDRKRLQVINLCGLASLKRVFGHMRTAHTHPRSLIRDFFVRQQNFKETIECVNG